MTEKDVNNVIRIANKLLPDGYKIHLPLALRIFKGVFEDGLIHGTCEDCKYCHPETSIISQECYTCSEYYESNREDKVD
jgi:hypothetical protein